ncbi:NTP transferase domain-containing protein [Rhodovastum atsumiense]|uniref:NTP transferase domain-containing protein n=1 Tax=Rhodovastum atsumiense TaxID=504468 RepID=A0A5M6IV64_9PROT|nr:NTP transferase domain-containing protein [Rhodovastum atsumiense]KAA5612203.1 NTP transferase domain-containing protein [Rhodovastum atsumiense]CAH2603840.1 NTP transferase domain-containing protein [Rhodovastum atsumiense]
MSASCFDAFRQEVGAVVLAAGWSSRMGAFKPLLPLGESTVVGRVVATLRQAGITRIHVVTGHQSEAMAPVLARLGVVGVANPGFTDGMLSSVRRGLSSFADAPRGCLLLPVDLPLVRPQTILRTLRAAAATGAAVVHPCMRGRRGHPPFIDRRLFAPILATDAPGGLRAILDRYPAEEVAVADRFCLHDLDEPADYRWAVRALAQYDIPDAEECAAMLAATGARADLCAHSQAVTDLALRIARQLRAAGVPLDLDLVRAGALLHDIAKGQPHHAAAGAALVAEWGFPEVARIVASHMALSFDPPVIDARAVVYLADKLVSGTARVSLAERFGPALARWHDNPDALAGARARHAAARAVLQAITARIGAADVLRGAEAPA